LGSDMGGFPPLVEIAAYGLSKGVFETYRCQPDSQ
jgi:hypothetical protein